MDSISGGSGSTQYGVEKLVGTNYKYWRMCMEAYLQGQDLWDLVSGADSVVPDDIPENAEARRKWKIKCGKALFALRTSISREYIDHVRDVDSPREVWGTLERLFTKKNTARLQLLENDLATLTQGGMSISEYFLKVKNICSEISQLDMDEPISEARLRRYLIRGLRKEYMPFVTSVQGWAVQPSVEELENLLSNQEALAKQISRKSIYEADGVLFSKWKLKEKENSKAGVGGDKYSAKSSTSNADSSTTPQQKYSSKKCYRCGKIGHIKKYCRVKLVKANTACENDDSDKLKWEQCFSIETAQKQGKELGASDQIEAFVNYVDYKKEWILDSGCSHHVTGNSELVSNIHKHNGDRVIITADNSIHPVVNEGTANINAHGSMNSGVVLKDVYHVPGLKKNLVSVSQITDSGKYVLFGPKDVMVLDKLKNVEADILLVGEKKESLFVMSAGEAYVKQTSKNDRAAIWHARLGHVGYQMLQQISSKKLLDGVPVLKDVHTNVVCQGCQYGKSHRLPFKRSLNRKNIMKGWRCMDPETKKFLTSRDVVFDEVSSFPKGVESAQFLPETSTPFSPIRQIEDTPDNVSVSSNFDNDGHTMSTLRRSTRERRQPDYFKDYEVGLNQCSVTSCFLVGAINGSEPCCYDEARGISKWEVAMQEEITALMKNETWELVPKSKDCEPVTCKCMFVKMESGKRVVVLLYVDDMIITGNNEDEISRLKNDLSIRFEMKNLGEVGCFLGLEVERSEDGFFVSQKGYAKNLFTKALAESKFERFRAALGMLD
ncbi:hypothetical protein RJ639_001301 [Escallonia herrerae]|uniref:CCHC-type domain-containing protein n=1 Tax=Escallonia herrerae TaxID=1293975 RepID=A0AA89BSB7_9ASTE|nr:hypothetical protein RJ639_001301 [Escallonia herrerae]